MSDNPPIWLIILSKIYAFGWMLYHMIYKLGIKSSRKPPCCVVCVGNLTVGGTSKTPTVIAIAKSLRLQGYNVVISSSGYGGILVKKLTILTEGKKIPGKYIGDEPALIRLHLPDIPIIIGKNRLAGALVAWQKLSPDVILLDDGYQHLPLARDVNILSVNGKKPWGNGYCLPAGTLREPLTGLSRSSALIVNTGGSDDITDEITSAVRGSIPIFKSTKKVIGFRNSNTFEIESQLPDIESGIIAVNGIGTPDSFMQSLNNLSLNVLQSLSFGDHHAYTEHDALMINNVVDETKADIVLTTDKDLVKLSDYISLISVPVYSLVIEVEIENDKHFIEWLTAKINGTKQEIGF